jgi:NADPH:quinone reductase-like Zn-dependent oxidoreductase
MALVGGGAQAELALVDETAALAVPDAVSWAEAGGFVEVYATAHDALFRQCDLTLGDRVLVTGAAGGVGTAAVQLAALAGARVVASVRRPELRPALVELGAVEALDPDEAPSRGPFDVALELVGAASLPAVLGALATGGAVAIIGVGGGARVEVDLLTLMGRRARISGATLRARSLLEKAAVIAAVEAGVVPHLASGRLQVPLAATFPMDEAPAAYDRFGAGGKLGKIVLLAPD